jgi:Ni2+-binding GTPase involved in maturation of urease and hydrogenase
MTIIGFMGNQGVGKTTVLKLFVDYLEKQKISQIEGGVECTIEKVDFKGETEIKVEGEDGYTKTVTPNKVVFTETESNTSHTLFAPGGDRDRAVVRMGIITISRIAKQIVAIFDVSQSVKEQFKLFDLIRYMPKSIYVCLNKFDLLDAKDKDKKITKMKAEIEDYFTKRKIEIKNIFYTCAIDNPDFVEYNDNAARMILDISLSRV